MTPTDYLFDLFSVDGRGAVVTGGSSGIARDRRGARAADDAAAAFGEPAYFCIRWWAEDADRSTTRLDYHLE